MLIVMAGLPGSGKSAISRALAARLDGVRLDKDHIRASIFPAGTVDYTSAQNDLCMEVVYEVAAYLLKQKPDRPVIVDGRPFSKKSQLERLRAFAAEAGLEWTLIECVCSDETARARIEADLDADRHPAADRDYEMYLRVKTESDSIALPRLVLRTDQESLDACVERATEYVREQEA